MTDDKAIHAYHFLRADLTAGHGSEPPWTVGEERTLLNAAVVVSPVAERDQEEEVQ